jgi:hypothetical protein
MDGKDRIAREGRTIPGRWRDSQYRKYRLVVSKEDGKEQYDIPSVIP